MAAGVGQCAMAGLERGQLIHSIVSTGTLLLISNDIGGLTAKHGGFMHLHLIRISTGEESTAGALHINGEFVCFTLEDTKRIKKVHGETRIPDGLYKIALRNEGGMTKKYASRYGAMHRGMLWVQNVPNFEWIYIHAGNKRGHTEGCILVGDSLNNNKVDDGFVGKSRDAYERIYPFIAKAIEAKENVTIRISNLG